LDVTAGGVVLHDVAARVRGRHGAHARALLMEIGRPFLADVARSEFGVRPPDALTTGARLLADPALPEMQLALWRTMAAGCDAVTTLTLARAIAVRLLGRHLIEAPPHDAGRRIARVLDYIERNLEGTLRLAAMADLAGQSIFHFSRVFRREMGTSPQAFVRRRRVARARRLLEVTDLPLAEIAYACGFAHQSHFTNVFRELTGATPGAYRVRLRRGGRADEA
jgi:AraC family transcriptional regulator